MALQVAVIGGGISGLASAWRIAGLGHRVTLFEGETFLGGLGTTFPWRDRDLERFYHCILPDDDALVRLIRELGLDDELLWKQTSMGFMHRGRIYPLDGPLDLLRFSPLTLIERFRLGLMGLRVRRAGSDPALDDVPIGDWIRGQIGDRAFDVLWRPLLQAKIGDQYPGIPALWMASRMSREKNTAAEVKGCLVRGYRSLIDAFERGLVARGATLRLGTRIQSIERLGERMAVRLDDGRVEAFDTVVATSPLPQFQRMTRSLELPAGLADVTLDYQGVVSGVFLFERPLSRHYWMPVVDSGATLQGVIEMSNLLPPERAHGLHVTYAVNYTHRDSALYARSDEDLLATYRDDLARLFPGRGGRIVEQHLFRAPFVEPIWPLGWSKRRPPTSVLPGRLYLACTAQVYPHVNSWNSCCEVVESMLPAFAAETRAIEPGEARASA